MPHESAQSFSERMRITDRRADETYSGRNARHALEAETMNGEEWEARLIALRQESGLPATLTSKDYEDLSRNVITKTITSLEANAIRPSRRISMHQGDDVIEREGWSGYGKIIKKTTPPARSVKGEKMWNVIRISPDIAQSAMQLGGVAISRHTGLITYSHSTDRVAGATQPVNGRIYGAEAVPAGRSAFLLLRSPLFKEAVGHLISNNQPYSIRDSAQYDEYLADLV